jgi:hypothetical protein
VPRSAGSRRRRALGVGGLLHVRGGEELDILDFRVEPEEETD